MRGDGYELATSVGKLPGTDRNGPSVPLRQGRHDLGRLRLAFEALLDRFSTEDMVCCVPSFGMELQTVARAIAALNDRRPLLAFGHGSFRGGTSGGLESGRAGPMRSVWTGRTDLNPAG